MVVAHFRVRSKTVFLLANCRSDVPLIGSRQPGVAVKREKKIGRNIKPGPVVNRAMGCAWNVWAVKQAFEGKVEVVDDGSKVCAGRADLSHAHTSSRTRKLLRLKVGKVEEWTTPRTVDGSRRTSCQAWAELGSASRIAAQIPCMKIGVARSQRWTDHEFNCKESRFWIERSSQDGR